MKRMLKSVSALAIVTAPLALAAGPTSAPSAGTDTSTVTGVSIDDSTTYINQYVPDDDDQTQVNKSASPIAKSYTTDAVPLGGVNTGTNNAVNTEITNNRNKQQVLPPPKLDIKENVQSGLQCEDLTDKRFEKAIESLICIRGYYGEEQKESTEWSSFVRKYQPNNVPLQFAQIDCKKNSQVCQQKGFYQSSSSTSFQNQVMVFMEGQKLEEGTINYQSWEHTSEVLQMVISNAFQTYQKRFQSNFESAKFEGNKNNHNYFNGFSTTSFANNNRDSFKNNNHLTRDGFISGPPRTITIQQNVRQDYLCEDFTSERLENVIGKNRGFFCVRGYYGEEHKESTEWLSFVREHQSNNAHLQFAQIDCKKYPEVCQQYSINQSFYQSSSLTSYQDQVTVFMEGQKLKEEMLNYQSWERSSEVLQKVISNAFQTYQKRYQSYFENAKFEGKQNYHYQLTSGEYDLEHSNAYFDDCKVNGGLNCGNGWGFHTSSIPTKCSQSFRGSVNPCPPAGDVVNCEKRCNPCPPTASLNPCPPITFENKEVQAKHQISAYLKKGKTISFSDNASFNNANTKQTVVPLTVQSKVECQPELDIVGITVNSGNNPC